MSTDFALFHENAGAVNNARDFRRFFERIMGFDPAGTPGTNAGSVFRPGDYAVSQRAAGANMSVDVALGGAYVDGTEDATQGGYYVFNDAIVNVAIAASNPVNPRIDIVGIRVDDTEYTPGTDAAEVVVITGTPLGVPAEPTLPDNFLTLARVDVAAAAASITNANITDRRRRAALLGGIIICTSTTRPATPFEGMHIYETDTDREYFYSGTTWLITGGALPHGRTTRMPFTGTRSTTSSSFAAIATNNIQVANFVKHRADTFLRFDATLAGYATVGVAGIEIAAQCNGVDNVVIRDQFNAVNSVVDRVAGSVDVAGIPAGTYTVTFRWRRSSGAGTLNTDNTLQGTLSVTELLG